MVFNYYEPLSLSPGRLDRYLANGWFRSGHMLTRSQLICWDDDLAGVVNIRLKLPSYEFPKRLRKIFRRCNERFYTEVRPAAVDEVKEELYQAHRHRFTGFIFDTLEEYFSGDVNLHPFDTWEMNVYERESGKLVGFSFFDRGKKSLASLMGIYDQAYQKHSVGIFTMLTEIIYAQEEQYKFYYPGYVLDVPSMLDYKLRLKQLEYYNWKGKWLPYHLVDYSASPNFSIRKKNDDLWEALQESGLSFKWMVNPFFALGYAQDHEDQFVVSPVFFSIAPQKRDRSWLIAEYEMEASSYKLSRVDRALLSEFIVGSMPEEVKKSDNYSLELLTYRKVIGRSRFLPLFLDMIRNQFS